jgi:sortase A
MTLRTFIFAVVVVAAALFVTVLFRATVYAPVETTYAPVATAFPLGTTTPAQQPVRLKIPKLAIDAAVEQTGLNAKGEMGIPSNFSNVAWYRYGPLPGQQGSAVIDGHVDNGLALPGVFKRLGELAPGDELMVETAGGESLRFVVEAVERYDYRAVPTEHIFNRRDAARLNLITCAGAWLADGKTYDERLVVYAVFMPE